MSCDHDATDGQDYDDGADEKKNLRHERRRDEVSVTHCGCKCTSYPSC